MKLRLINATRESGRQGMPGRYRADIEADGKVIGHVERAWSMGGAYGRQYVAKVDGLMVGIAATLADLRYELGLWLAERGAS